MCSQVAIVRRAQRAFCFLTFADPANAATALRLGGTVRFEGRCDKKFFFYDFRQSHTDTAFFIDALKKTRSYLSVLLVVL